jgi:hypothetical protein
MQMNSAATAITAKQPANAPAPRRQVIWQTDSPEEKPAPKEPAPVRPSEESLHTVLIRFLGDLDDLLDTIHDPASFEAVKPKLLRRAQQQAELAAQKPNRGGAQLSKAAGKELQKAVNRHTASMERAIGVAPGVKRFFEKDMAAILNAK